MSKALHTLRGALRTLAVAALAALLSEPAARAVVLDSSGIPADPPPPSITCTLTQNDIVVTSFADIIGYQIKGSCKVSFPGTPLPPVPWSPYEGGGSWNANTGQVNEFLKGKDLQGHAWEIADGGNCKLDPWMTGRAAASCSGKIGTSSPSAPSNFLKKLAAPITPDLLDGTARAWLTGKTLVAMKAEHQAPTITKPTNGEMERGDVSLAINAGPNSPTKTFAVQWQAKVGGQWVDKNVDDQVGPSSNLDASKFGISGPWRLHARAHQSTNAEWSDWRSFTWEPAIKLGPPPCKTTKAYAATYGVSATPSTMKAGTTTVVSITLSNDGSLKWTTAGNFHLAYHWMNGAVAVVYDGARTLLPADVQSCGTVKVNATLTAPPTPGTYTLQWDLVQENVTWFSTQGVPTGNRSVVVTP